MTLRRTPLTRRSELRQRPSCTHPGCASSTICRRKSKPLQAKTPPRTRTALPRVNRERRAKRFESDFGGKAYLAFIHGHSCAACGVTGWTVAAHVKSRGAGGKASDIVPLCGTRYGVTGCHDLLDCSPWLLPEGTVMRLRALAKRLWREWNERRESESGT